MDITTVFALIAVIIGPIALYFLRRGNVRSNGIIGGVNWEKFQEKQRKWWEDTTSPMKFYLPSNIWHEDS